MIAVSSFDHVSLHRTSPPITPPPLRPNSADEAYVQQPSPAFSEDIPVLTFDYVKTAEGVYERVSDGSSKYSPPSISSQQSSPVVSDSPLLAPGSRRASLSRSESVPSVVESSTTARSFKRVSSGPLPLPSGISSTPAASLTRFPSSSGLNSTARRIVGGGPRRIPVNETDERVRAEVEHYKQRELKMQTQEKENADALPASSSVLPLLRPLADVVPLPQRGLSAHGRQVLPVPSRRLLKKVETIAEAEDVDEENAVQRHAAALVSSTGTRPRRSASLSEGHADSGPPPHFQQPARSTLVNGSKSLMGARRVTLEEKLRQEREIGAQEGYALREAEEAAEAERRAHALVEAQGTAQAYTRQSPSPTHISSQPQVRPSYGHQRRDSDTLRNSGTSLVIASSPTLAAGERPSLPPRVSPPRGYPSSVLPFSSNVLAASNLRHRRNPTAPEPPTTSGMIAPPGLSGTAAAKTWAAGEGREQDLEIHSADEDFRPKSAPSMQQQPIPVQQVQSAPSVQAPQPVQQILPITDRTQRQLYVNKKPYARLDMIGKGGSSRVYRVMNGSNEIYAIKRVSLDKTDSDTLNGYMNEISLLKRLDGNSRIIRLLDSEVRGGPGGSKGYLMLVMECGEIDLAKLLQEQQKETVDLVWIAYYWKQMLQAVHVIHEEKIVHSDLKPANFVLVRGQLKLIDFGIANAIANDTTNIQRDHQIGTVNYMSPEAIELPDGMRRLKVGRPSDIWSLGCILYQMVYGHPPFYHLSVYQKMKAIPDENHIIPFPEYTTPSISRSGSSPPKKIDNISIPVPESVIKTMKSCLIRDSRQRATIPQLLAENWLTMREPEPAPPPPPTPPAPTPPPPPPSLKPDETIINPYFMQQLLRYGMALGLEGRTMEGEDLLREAERLVLELKSVNAA